MPKMTQPYPTHCFFASSIWPKCPAYGVSGLRTTIHDLGDGNATEIGTRRLVWRITTQAGLGAGWTGVDTVEPLGFSGFTLRLPPRHQSLVLKHM